MSVPARRGLGRGLSALLSEATAEQPVDAAGPLAPGIRMEPLSHMRPHPGQPRRRFDPDALAELAASIAERGLIQPIVVRPHSAGYLEIVAGERRWRAAQQAQLKHWRSRSSRMSSEKT